VSVRTGWLHAPLVLVTSSSLSGSRVVHWAIFRLVLRIVPWRVRSMIGVWHGIIIYTQILIELWRIRIAPIPTFLCLEISRCRQIVLMMIGFIIRVIVTSFQRSPHDLIIRQTITISLRL
jgi:hypothetical protein